MARVAELLHEHLLAVAPEHAEHAIYLFEDLMHMLRQLQAYADLFRENRDPDSVLLTEITEYYTACKAQYQKDTWELLVLFYQVRDVVDPDFAEKMIGILEKVSGNFS